MDDYASMEEKDAMYATYAKLIGAVLSEENIKPLSELERVAENNMGKFLETYNVQGLDMEEKKRRLHQSYMIVGKYAMKLQYIDRQGNHDGARALRLTDSIASKLQKVSKNIRKKATSDDVVVPE